MKSSPVTMHQPKYFVLPGHTWLIEGDDTSGSRQKSSPTGAGAPLIWMNWNGSHSGVRPVHLMVRSRGKCAQPPIPAYWYDNSGKGAAIDLPLDGWLRIRIPIRNPSRLWWRKVKKNRLSNDKTNPENLGDTTGVADLTRQEAPYTGGPWDE